MQIWEYFIVYISCTSHGIRHIGVDILAYALFMQVGFLFSLFSGNLPWVSSAYTNRRVHTRPSYGVLQFELNQFSYLFCFICQFCTNNIVPSKSGSTRRIFFFFFFLLSKLFIYPYYGLYIFLSNLWVCQPPKLPRAWWDTAKKKWTSITSFISIIFFF